MYNYWNIMGNLNHIMLFLGTVFIGLIIQSCTQTDKYNPPEMTKYFRHHSIDSKYPFGHISATNAGDIDGDGYLDIVIRSGKSGEAEIAWYKNPMNKQEKNAKWQKYRISDDAYPSGGHSSGSSLLVHDVNRDGKPDVITGAKVQGIGNGLFWWESPKDITSDNWTRYLIAGPDHESGEEYAPHDMQITDIDQDQINDLVVAGSSNQGVYWARIPVDPKKSESWKLHRVGRPRGSAFSGLAVGDIDNDGRVDIVHADVWYQSSGLAAEPHWKPHPYGLINFPPSHVALHDLDGDDYLDIIVSSGHNGSQGSVVWYRAPKNNGTLWPHSFITQGLAAPENLVVLEDQNLGGLVIFTAELDFLNLKEQRLALVFSLSDINTNTWEKNILHKGKNFRMMQMAYLDNDEDMDLYAVSFTEADGYAHVDWFENISE